MPNPRKNSPLAGPYGAQPASPKLFSTSPGSLTEEEQETLWELFQQIGRVWNNVWNDSAGQRSSWLEFVTIRCHEAPSYLEEYRNAIRVIEELTATHGLVEGYERLFLHGELADGSLRSPIRTRLDHAKVYVVNEFIRVQIVAGGFRGFGADENGKNREKHRPYNYNGFVRGSRYNRTQRVRAYRPEEEQT